MAQAMERLLATPKTVPSLPASNDMGLPFSAAMSMTSLAAPWQGRTGPRPHGGRISRATNVGIRGRSAGLRPGGSGAVPGNAAGPEAGAPMAMSRCSPLTAPTRRVSSASGSPGAAPKPQPQQDGQPRREKPADRPGGAVSLLGENMQR